MGRSITKPEYEVIGEDQYGKVILRPKVDYTPRIVLSLIRNYAKLRSGVTLKSYSYGDKVQTDSMREDVLVSLCDIDQAVEKLPLSQWITMQYVMAGHTAPDIAEMMDIPVGTVKWRIHFAARKIYKHLQPNSLLR